MTDVDVAVVGAGMAGLTAASELSRVGLSVRVLESCPRVGGRMTSFRHDGYTVDTGAEQISPSGYRATWELLSRLGMGDVEVPRLGGSVAMWRGGRGRPGVAEARGMLTGAGLSPRARLDLARFQTWAHRRADRFDTDRPESTPLGGATLAEFARHYHPDLHDYLFQPVAGTFFGWNPDRCAAAAMVSLMLEVGDASRWRTYRDGMDTAARRLAAELDVVTGQQVRQVVANGSSARVSTGADSLTARAVLLCVPAPVAAQLHANPTDDESAFLSAATYNPALKVSCLLERPLSPRGRGTPYALLIPALEDDALSAIIFDHRKNPNRAPRGRGLLTLMPTASTTRSLLELPHEQLVRRLTGAAEHYLPGLISATRHNFVHRHEHGLPEVTPQSLALRPRFAARGTRSVDYAGDWVAQRPASEGAVRSGVLAASRLLSHLAEQPAPIAVRAGTSEDDAKGPQ